MMEINSFKYNIGLLSSYYRVLYRKLFKTAAPYGKVNGSRVIKKHHEANEVIGQMIDSGKPFMIGRFGSVELSIVGESYKIWLGKQKRYPERIIHTASNNAGIFSAEHNTLMRFSECMLQCAKDLDYIGLWNDKSELFTVKNFAPQAKGIELWCLEPYYQLENAWTHHLKGKMVLVVSPFAKSIESRFDHKQYLFDENFWPECEWIPFQAVQTISGNKDDRFKTWFDALDYMISNIRNIDFDIAVIGCGAYGFPLASAIKNMGKQAIHLGGATQILFGIRGKRWDDSELNVYFNEHWVYPGEDEKPKGLGKVENGCYW